MMTGNLDQQHYKGYTNEEYARMYKAYYPKSTEERHSKETLYALAMRYAHNNMHFVAVDYFSQLMKHEFSVEMLLDFATSLMHIHQLSQALQLLNHKRVYMETHSSKTLFRYYYLKATILERLGKFKRALPFFITAAQISPHAVTPIIAQARVLEQLQRYRDAAFAWFSLSFMPAASVQNLQDAAIHIPRLTALCKQSLQ